MFDGETYDDELDGGRLRSQLARVRKLLLGSSPDGDGRWHTMEEINAVGKSANGSGSASTRVRDLRKRKFGAYIVESRRADGSRGGLWEYRIVPGSRGQGRPESRRGYKQEIVELRLEIEQLRYEKRRLEILLQAKSKKASGKKRNKDAHAGLQKLFP